MKRIAVASEGERVADHFGRCSQFNIFDIEDGKIVNSQMLDTPEKKHGNLPVFLEDNNVGTVIAGGIGRGAVEKLGERNITIISGAEGLAQEVVKDYLKGILETKDGACKGHEGGHGHGEGHSCGEGHRHQHAHEHRSCSQGKNCK